MNVNLMLFYCNVLVVKEPVAFKAGCMDARIVITTIAKTLRITSPSSI